MSLYNLTCGVNPLSLIYLQIIGVEYQSIPRFRDVYVSETGNIVIYTRTGGGNRDDYWAENDELTKNPNYISDNDDNFDCTYAHFHFKVPETHKKLVEELSSKYNETPQEKFEAVLKSLKNG